MNENIIRTISSEMNRYLNNYQMSKLQEVLYKKVEVEKKVISNEEYVNKFINSKRLEGCSELTIKNYKIHIYKMLSYLDKDVRTIETDDIREFLSYYQSNNNCNNLTIDGVRRSLSSFFTFLEVEDYIVKSPIRRIHKIKTEFLIKETYSDELMESTSVQVSHISSYVNKLLDVMETEVAMTTSELMEKLGMKSRISFRDNYLNPALENGLIKMTNPDKPTSKNQMYYKV